MGKIEELMYHRIHKASIVLVSYIPDKQVLVTVDKDGNVIKWSVPEYSIIDSFQLNKAVDVCMISNNHSKIVFSIRFDHEIWIYDLNSQKILKSMPFNGDNIRKLDYCSYCNLVAIQTDTYNVKVWKVNDNTLWEPLYKKERLHDIKLGKNNFMMYLATKKGSIYLFKLFYRRIYKIIDIPILCITHLKICEDRKYLVACNNKKLYILNIATGKKRSIHNCDMMYNHIMQISRDKSTILTLETENLLGYSKDTVFNIATEDKNTGSITSLDIDEFCKKLAIGYSSGLIRVLNIKNITDFCYEKEELSANEVIFT